MTTFFSKLNHDWDADPNNPDPKTIVVGDDLLLTFKVNHRRFPGFRQGDTATLRFSNCSRYRLGFTNDEGWYNGDCRFSKLAPEWGEFYEVGGELLLEMCPNDWIYVADIVSEKSRHFLFYFRDETFECDAEDYAVVLNRVYR